MKRTIDFYLSQWKSRQDRKPLILRGARQVGKTHAIRRFGKTFDTFVEVNFEMLTVAKSIFEQDLSPTRIVRDLGLLMGQTIVPGNTLLFLDEVQEQPQALVALRYLYEHLPELHVIAAGSLLDFAIEQIGVPVGRVEFLYMHPVSFMEYLCACGMKPLAEAIVEQNPKLPLSEAVHDRTTKILGEYLATGGMPEAVQDWLEYQDLESVMRIQQNIVNGYLQDIPKYARKHQIETVDVIFKHIPTILGQKFKSSSIHGEYRKRELAPAIDLLSKAMIIHKVYHTSAQGLPLGAQRDLEKYKLITVDFALSQRLINSDQRDWILNPKDSIINKGPVIEAFIGQEIAAYQDPTRASELYYWHREERGSTAEIDYVTALQHDIIPIEVKSDKGGNLKSMRLFLSEHKKSTYGVRFSNYNFSFVDSVYSYPLYAVAGLFPSIRQSVQAL